MQGLARLTAPIVWFLDKSSAVVFSLLGLTRESDDKVTAEELHLVVAEASRSGVIEESERAIISGVVRLADRPVREVMTPRTEIDWLDADADSDAIRKRLMETPHTRLPVGAGSVDSLIGVVQARDIIVALFKGQAINLRKLMRKATVVSDQLDAALLATGDRADDELYSSLLLVRSSFLDTMSALSASLSELMQFNSAQPLPALTLANRLYQDVGRADELIQESDVPHPAFMPVSMKVLRQ